MSAQTASNPGIRYDAVSDDDVGLHLELVDVVYFTLEALRTCQQVLAGSACKQSADAERRRRSSVFPNHLCLHRFGGTATGMDSLVADVTD